MLPVPNRAAQAARTFVVWSLRLFLGLVALMIALVLLSLVLRTR